MKNEQMQQALKSKLRVGATYTEQDLTAFVLGVEWAQENRKLLFELEVVQMRANCKHEFKWHQIAGEGQICKLCGLHNLDCDD